MPIKTFADQTAADIYAGHNTKSARRIAQQAAKKAARKLDAIDAATQLADLAAVPGNRLEELKYTKPGFYSLRIDQKYRIFFRFENGDAYDVQIEGDDHTGG